MGASGLPLLGGDREPSQEALRPEGWEGSIRPGAAGGLGWLGWGVCRGRALPAALL